MAVHRTWLSKEGHAHSQAQTTAETTAEKQQQLKAAHPQLRKGQARMSLQWFSACASAVVAGQKKSDWSFFEPLS
jgi:hypothetical protein